MTIVRWDSFRDVAALQDRMSQMLEEAQSRPRNAWEPAVDIYSNAERELC